MTDQELDLLVEQLLNAAGTGLRHFSFSTTRRAMRDHLRDCLGRRLWPSPANVDCCLNGHGWIASGQSLALGQGPVPYPDGYSYADRFIPVCRDRLRTLMFQLLTNAL